MGSSLPASAPPRTFVPPPAPAAPGERIRPLGPDAAAALTAHLLSLHPDDRAARFAHPIGDRRIAAYVAGIDWGRSLAFGWVEDGVLRAAAQAHWPAVDWLAGNAELAVSVERPWQRRGIGTALVAHLGLAARARRLPGLYITAQTDNDAVRALTRRLGVPLRSRGVAVEGFMPLEPHGPAPDWLTAALARGGLGPHGAPEAPAAPATRPTLLGVPLPWPAK